VDAPVNTYLQFHPSWWWKVTHWDRWPWQPKWIGPHGRTWGAKPYAVEVRENGTPIGWTPVDSIEVTTVIEVGGWSALRSLFKKTRLEVMFGADPEYRSPEVIEQTRRSEETLRLTYQESDTGVGTNRVAGWTNESV
jgi:hypothetical protein